MKCRYRRESWGRKGRRGVGSPKLRWLDDVREYFKNYWISQRIETVTEESWEKPRPELGCSATDDYDSRLLTVPIYLSTVEISCWFVFENILHWYMGLLTLTSHLNLKIDVIRIHSYWKWNLICQNMQW